MNKRGWLQVVEACVAVLILIGFVLIVMNKINVKETNLQEKVNGFVLKIEQNDELRQKILNDNPATLDSIKDFIGYENCAISVEDLPPGKEIYSASVIINNLDIFKTFMLYIWK